MDPVSLIFTLAENVKTLVDTGKWIVESVQSFRNASSLIQRWNEYGFALCEGALNLQIELAKSLGQRTNDLQQRASIARHLEILADIVVSAKDEMEKYVEPKNRLYFAIRGRKKLKTILGHFEKALFDFSMYIILLDRLRESSASATLLTGTTFRTTSYYAEGEDSAALDRDVNIRLSTAEYLEPGPDGELADMDVLIERQSSEQTTMPELVELLQHLSIEPLFLRGILRCLGYRKEPHLELVFQIPQGFSDPITLRTLISNLPERRERIQVSRQIADALAVVHAAKMVHKSLRPDTVIVFEDSASSDSMSGRLRPFLTNWSMLRKLKAASAHRSSDAWPENIYRHPNRQKIWVGVRYHMGHDIYSLGVTLLELGLADSFIVFENEEVNCSEIYRRAARELALVDTEMTEPQIIKTLYKPNNVKEIMLHLAHGELRDRMGNDFAQIVETCLCAVDEGLVGVQGFEDDTLSVAERFRQAVIEPLGRLCEPESDDE